MVVPLLSTSARSHIRGPRRNLATPFVPVGLKPTMRLPKDRCAPRWAAGSRLSASWDSDLAVQAPPPLAVFACWWLPYRHRGHPLERVSSDAGTWCPRAVPSTDRTDGCGCFCIFLGPSLTHTFPG